MALFERGRVQDGGIVFSSPLTLPEGTEVEVRIEPLPEGVPGGNSSSVEGFADLPFFGMWADRGEMQDSASWVEEQREKWQRRAGQTG